MDLPQDIIEKILTPVKPLIRFRCVSKHWCALLTTDTSFINSHLTQSKQIDGNHQGLIIKPLHTSDYLFIPRENFDEEVVKLYTSCLSKPFMRIVDSLNGLVCLFTNESRSLSYIWNPATRECKPLPYPTAIKPTGWNQIVLGFGFDPTTNDYKVVRIFVPYFFGAVLIEIYSLSTYSWRRLEDVPFYMIDDLSKANVNGSVHWLADNSSKVKLIACVDMINEVFKEIPLPDDIGPDGHVKDITTFRGCLSVFVFYHDESHLWVMKDYPAKESWVLLCSIGRSEYSYLLHPLNNGEFLCDSEDGLTSYNLESRELKIVQNPELKPEQGYWLSFYYAVPYVESLVPVMVTSNQAETQQGRKHHCNKYQKADETSDQIIHGR